MRDFGQSRRALVVYLLDQTMDALVDIRASDASAGALAVPVTEARTRQLAADIRELIARGRALGNELRGAWGIDVSEVPSVRGHLALIQTCERMARLLAKIRRDGLTDDHHRSIDEILDR